VLQLQVEAHGQPTFPLLTSQAACTYAQCLASASLVYCGYRTQEVSHMVKGAQLCCACVHVCATHGFMAMTGTHYTSPFLTCGLETTSLCSAAAALCLFLLCPAGLCCLPCAQQHSSHAVCSKSKKTCGMLCFFHILSRKQSVASVTNCVDVCLLCWVHYRDQSWSMTLTWAIQRG